jgi:arsenite-transporting ATPase
VLLALAATKRLMFVGGKGGVGKTSVASALAYARAVDGARVLLISTDPAHNLGHLWDLRIGDTHTTLHRTEDGVLDAVEIDPAATVAQHLQGVRRTMRKLLPERIHGQAERHLDLARDAPGTHESAILDRLATIILNALKTYDLVVVDTAPSGHTLRLLALPEQLTAWTDLLLANRERAQKLDLAEQTIGGSRSTSWTSDPARELGSLLVERRRRFSELSSLIEDPSRTSFVVVTTAERLPVAETLDTQQCLCTLGVNVGAVVANRLSPPDQGAVLASRRTLENARLEQLRQGLPGNVPLVTLPLLPGDLFGRDGMSVLSEKMRATS